MGMLCLSRSQVWGACLPGLCLLWPHFPLLWLAPSRVLLVLSPARTARFASFFLASVSKNSVPLCAKEDDLQNNLLRRKLTSPLLLAQEVGEFVLALRLGVRGLVASVLVRLSHCIVVGGPFPCPASRYRLCCRTARLCCGRWPSFWQSDWREGWDG